MQSAIARVLAQQAIGDPAIVPLTKRVDVLRQTRQELWARLNELYGLPDNQRSTDDLTKQKQTLSTVQQDLDKAEATLKATAPRYAELARPEAIGLQDVQRLLRQNEAFVSFYTLPDRLQVWLVRPGQTVHYHES